MRRGDPRHAEFRDLEREEKQRVLDLAIGPVPADLPVDARLLSGSPGPLLAEASGVDLMLAGSRGYGASATALGSVAAHLVDSAACPVLVLPRGWAWIRSRSAPTRLERSRRTSARAPCLPRR